MKKATQSPSDPFAQYFQAYKELTQSLEHSKSAEDINKLTQKINSILQLHYKAIMSYYDKQYRQIVEHIEDNNKRFEQLAQKTTSRTQEFLEQSVKQSNQMMQQNMAHFKQMFKAQPKELLDQVVQEANANLTEQTKRWNELYAKQQEDVQKDMQALQAQAKTLLENSEELRQDSLAKYKELEKTVQEFLSKKQTEFKGKVGDSGSSAKDSHH
jgi:ATP-dependent Clp protease ATP-binding subunit ClpA